MGHADAALPDDEIDRAILLGNSNSGNAAFPDYDACAALASAYNDWLLERCSPADGDDDIALLVARVSNDDAPDGPG